VTEPNWDEFQIDSMWDTPNNQLGKLKGFMEAFIRWRKEANGQPIHEPEQLLPDPPKRKRRKTRAA
jgi:hypothetical protein